MSIRIRGGDNRSIVTNFNVDGVDAVVAIGASGNDSLTDGDGSDRFIYKSNAAFTSNAIGIDRITDSVSDSGTDKIVLDKTTFTALTKKFSPSNIA